MKRSWSPLSLTTTAVLSVTLAFGLSACANKNSAKAVAAGSAVTLRYALTADNAVIVPDNKPETLQLTVGGGKLPPMFEKALIGLPVGAAKAIQLKPEEAFGPIRKELIGRVPRASLPAGELKEGMVLGTGGVTARVAKIMEDGTVIIDRNHPLAGRTLLYKVRVTSVE
ncbi:MAG: FKBP-type peptidyl-prolyl cis-trans isomerase [Candidatus Omnitrophica bacterium]|jgi:FKBP-type peptidyl-prolyl cis-trans isomerase 2|nr:FKBP-type peptidyl-prolyl cis-trans isomerase [Candidatus Omnitrophota bacterium]